MDAKREDSSAANNEVKKLMSYSNFVMVVRGHMRLIVSRGSNSPTAVMAVGGLLPRGSRMRTACSRR